MATFSARTNLAYLLGFIADNIYQDLCVIRKVRNRFAHSSEDLDFDDEEIKANCANLRHYLKEKQRIRDNPRAQFICAVAALDAVLEFLVFDSQHVNTPVDGPEDLRGILDKQRDYFEPILTGLPPP